MFCLLERNTHVLDAKHSGSWKICCKNLEACHILGKGNNLNYLGESQACLGFRLILGTNTESTFFRMDKYEV